MYNAKIRALAEKYAQFHRDKTPGQILVMICPYTFDLDYTAWGLTHRPLSSWDFTREAEAFALRQVKSLRAFLDYTEGLDNDYVPALGVNMGYGVHSAYFSGAEVIMGDDTSWTHPWLTDWGKMDTLQLDTSNYWYAKILEITRYFMHYGDGDYAVSAFANAGPSDMANALRGDALFYDLYDEPNQVGRLMDKTVEAVCRLEEDLRALTGDVYGGHVTTNMWFPGQCPYLSEDFNDLCAAEVFNEFGRARTQRILDHFGGGFIHHHAKGRHIHAYIAAMKNLSMLEISLDPKAPRPVDFLDELFEQHGDLPLMIRCHATDVYQHIESMKKGRLILMLNIDNIEQGREVVRLIRKHSTI